MNIFKNNRGYSLAELVVATGIAVLLSTIATVAFSMAMEVFIRTARQAEAETEMLSAMFAIKGTFAQSINVVYGGDTASGSTGNNAYSARTASATKAADATLGKIYTTNFNSDAMASTPTVHMVALTVREMNSGISRASGSNVDVPDSNFFGSGVYFQRPGYDKSGALYIDQQNNSGTTPGGWVEISPVNSTLMFTRLTEFHVENIKVLKDDGTIAAASSADATTVNRPALAGEIRLGMRYFSKGRPSDWRWCPETLVSGDALCRDNTKTAYYTNIERKVKIVFSNNSYDRNKYLAERPFGYVYFFKSWIPTQREGL